jgi:protein-tyrosine phosphatase
MTGGSLGLQNATNARDLGGLPTIDGRSVRRGVLYRANAFNRLTESDLDAVGRLKLACLVDFRHPHEIEIVGVDRLPAPPPGRIVALPLSGPEHDLFDTVGAMFRGPADPKMLAMWRAEHDRGGTVAAMRHLYRWFVSADAAAEAFGRALRLIADPEALPLLFHCTAGKDRTGWLAALVLSILRVDRAVIIEDYLRTNELNAASTAYLLGRLEEGIDKPEVILPLLQARVEYIDEAFAEVDRVYGGMDTYLTAGLGLDSDTLAALRTNLLTPR